jgi:cold shock CspA family protein
MTDEHVIGCVKWFNKKSGFGFITMMEGTHVGKDIFVHHSGVTVGKDQYKYLVQGEYVQVDVVAGAHTGNHEYQSSKVTGVKGGKLMCETRSEMRLPARKEQEVEAAPEVVPTAEETVVKRKPRAPRKPTTAAPKKDTKQKQTKK